MTQCTSRGIISLFHEAPRIWRGARLKGHTMRLLRFLSLSLSAIVATLVLMLNVSTPADTKPLCRAPGVPKGCITRPALGTISTPYNSYNELEVYDPWPRPQGGPA